MFKKLSLDVIKCKKYGKLTVISESTPKAYPGGQKVRVFNCQCECGNFIDVALSHLRNGDTKSCGCIVKDKRKASFANLKSKKYGKLTIVDSIGYHEFPSGRKCKLVKCVCECGNEIIVLINSIKNGSTKSCGCLQVESAITHGYYRHPLYSVWRTMKDRCLNKNCKSYYLYGGRGINIYENWITNAGEFIEYCISLGYKKGLLLDRIDNEKGYLPGNLRFVNSTDSMRNRRVVKLDMKKAIKIRKIYSEKIYNQYELADLFGVSRSTIADIVNNRIWV